MSSASRPLMLAAVLVTAAVAAQHPLREIAIANIGDQEPFAVLLIPSGPGCNGPLTAGPLPSGFRRGPVSIGGRLAGPCAAQARLAVFSADRAAVFVSEEDLRQAGARLTVTLKPSLRLPVHVWYETPARKENASDEIANADWIFRRNLAGFVLQPEYEAFPAVDAPADGSDPDCSNPPPAPAYKPGAINIYYGIGGESVTCPEHDRVFVKASDGLGTLAHELGHALGLDSPDGDPERRYDSAGHTPGEPFSEPAPFDGANGMWRRSLIFRDTFTLGQVFWMNFNTASATPAYRAANGFSPGLPCRDHRGQCPFFRVEAVSAARNPPQSGMLLPNVPCPAERVALESTAEAIRTAIEARLIERPRYCTHPEVRRILEQRFTDVCGGGVCGSATAADFVARWGDRSGGIAAWVSDEGARIFAMRRLGGALCETSDICRARAAVTERTVIGYVRSDLISGIKDRRVLWLDEEDRVKPEADVFRKLLVQIDFVRDGQAQYTLIIASRQTAAPLLGSGAAHPPLIVYQPGVPYASDIGDEQKKEAKEKGAAGLTDCPFELYNLAVGELLKSK